MEERPLDEIPPILPGDKVLRRWRPPRRRLRLAPNIPGILRFLRTVTTQTPLLPILLVLVVLILLVATGVYLAERGTNESFDTYGESLWWSVAGMHTMGSSDRPETTVGKILGLGGVLLTTVIFFGAIIASVTAYFALPRHRPTRQLINTIQYNLGELDNLSLEELDVLREVTVRVIDAQADRLGRGSSGS
jgi:voltage-gated potassium channel